MLEASRIPNKMTGRNLTWRFCKLIVNIFYVFVKFHIIVYTNSEKKQFNFS